MKTNLIFKRQVTLNNVTKVVTRIVPVDIPEIDSGEGWSLSGHTDCIETTADMYVHRLAPPVQEEQLSCIPAECTEKDENVSKFESGVSGTAKLVRAKTGTIKIVARKGKQTYNQTSPNSVCINDFTKNEFFKNCREFHGGGSGIFEFTRQCGRPYDYWNNVIDCEYQRQKKSYLTKIKQQL